MVVLHPKTGRPGLSAFFVFVAFFVQVTERSSSHHFVETSPDGRRELSGRQGALAEADQGLHCLSNCPLEPARMMHEDGNTRTQQQ